MDKTKDFLFQVIEGWHGNLRTITCGSEGPWEPISAGWFLVKLVLLSCLERLHVIEADVLVVKFPRILEPDGQTGQQDNPRDINSYLNYLDGLARELLLFLKPEGNELPGFFQTPSIDDRKTQLRLHEFLMNVLLNALPEGGNHCTMRDLIESSSILFIIRAISRFHGEIIMKGRKRDRGAYYTPEWLVQYITARCFSMLEENATGCKNGSVPSILDPSCGTGAFLIDVSLELLSRYQQGDIHEHLAFKEYMLDILKHGIHGIEEDAGTAFTCRLLIILIFLDACQKNRCHVNIGEFWRLSFTICHGNALVGFRADESTSIMQEGQEKAYLKQFLMLWEEKSIHGLDAVTRLKHAMDALKSRLDAAFHAQGYHLDISNTFHPRYQFPHVFLDYSRHGKAFTCPGFDILLGNPPYVNYKRYLSKIDRNYLENRFQVFTGQSDLLYYFFELQSELLHPGGVSGQVVARYFLEAKHAKRLRKFLQSLELQEIVDFKANEPLFNAGVHVAIVFLANRAPVQGKKFRFLKVPPGQNLDFEIPVYLHQATFSTMNQHDLDEYAWSLLDEQAVKLQKRLSTFPRLADLGTCMSGSETGYDTAFVKHVTQEKDGSLVGIMKGRKYALESHCIHPWLKNRDIKKFHHQPHHHCIYINPELDEGSFKKRFPGTFRFLSQFKQRLLQRDGGKLQVPWYVWRRPKNVKNLNVVPKLVCPYKAPFPRFSIDTGKCYCSYDVTVFIPGSRVKNLDALIALLNSVVLEWYIKTYAKQMGNIIELYPRHVSKMVVPEVDNAMATKLAEAAKEYKIATQEIPAGLEKRQLLEIQCKIDALAFEACQCTELEMNVIFDDLSVNQGYRDTVRKILRGMSP
ncbi:hypothetical protein GF325_19115 [Candidatus Bathyarchaeota archaeon]|nr:hypothetical protein [Candidatus Bathyarchaeota archaeon]